MALQLLEQEPVLDDAKTVLDVVTHVQRTQDPTLAYRFACRVGMCGSCAMMIAGKIRLACETQVAALDMDQIMLSPLPHQKVVKDLAGKAVSFKASMGSNASIMSASPSGTRGDGA